MNKEESCSTHQVLSAVNTAKTMPVTQVNSRLKKIQYTRNMCKIIIRTIIRTHLDHKNMTLFWCRWVQTTYKTLCTSGILPCWLWLLQRECCWGDGELRSDLGLIWMTMCVGVDYSKIKLSSTIIHFNTYGLGWIHVHLNKVVKIWYTWKNEFHNKTD